MTDLTWKTEKRNLSDLKDFSKNPRSLSKKHEELLNNSISKLGYAEIIAIDADNTILAGHMRAKILKKQKYKEIDVRVPSRPLTEKEREIYCINSNLISGDWDYDILGNEWNPSELIEMGFEADQLFEGIGDIETIKAKEDDKDLDHNEKCDTCGQKIKNKSSSKKN